MNTSNRNRLRARRVALRVVLVSAFTGALPTFALAEDLSEALRLWKFTYQSEIAAYGTQYMSQSLLL